MDNLIDVSRRCRDLFREAGFELSYQEGPGRHDWDFWDHESRKVLDWLPPEDIRQGVSSGNVNG